MYKVAVLNKFILISPNGEYIISVNEYFHDERIDIWDIKTGKCLKTLYSAFLSSISILPDGNYIVLGRRDGKIEIWDFEIGECLKTLDGHLDYVSSITISPDGKYIVSGSYDETIRIWDIKTGENIYTIDNSYNISINNNGYFIGSDEDIDKYLRVSEEPLTQRKLTLEEINHFRKKGDFLEVGEIIEKPKVEEIFIEKEKIEVKIPEIDIDEDEIPF